MKTNSCKRVCIFCGSKLGNSKVWTNSAKKLGCFLGMKSVTIIFGGGRWGIMGTIATSAKINGSKVTGVITKKLIEMENVIDDLDNLIVVDTMAERKAKLVELADILLVLPGGIGTVDELFDFWTKVQLGIDKKPILIWNINGHYNKLLEFVTVMTKEGFVSLGSSNNLVVVEKFDDLVFELSKLEL